MTSNQAPRPRPHSAGLAKNIEERRVIRKRRVVMLLIVLVGVGIIVWDFLRPPRPAAPKPAVEAPSNQPR